MYFSPVLLLNMRSPSTSRIMPIIIPFLVTAAVLSQLLPNSIMTLFWKPQTNFTCNSNTRYFAIWQSYSSNSRLSESISNIMEVYAVSFTFDFSCSIILVWICLEKKIDLGLLALYVEVYICVQSLKAATD